MASFAARRLFPTSSRRVFSTSLRRLENVVPKEELKQQTKRNPELMILGGVMVAAIGGAGFYFARSPTGVTSESVVNIAKSGMPWESDTDGKYHYHPGGDPKKDPKQAPSALNVVIVPDVTLPKEMHDKFNKWGKDGYP
ncbi:hypothetical protein L249_0885 [Ophiocordyceps polyrhachis-furcata BCC 54312]|uniref:Uncharacterized protein n=1 Tax=Ophiocordyceps polyrhachis-furcata BCC 54312 TaxID=1330021 RepID=A0A367LCD7_9HYPO|nr:hypothetical protein L249_0885 [Ophiocordyceps polyrhachis-furcata BCC 54312]